MLVLQTQYTQHVISSIWKTCKYSGTEVTDIIKDNNEIFGSWLTRTEPNQAKFHGTHFKKNKWFAKNFWLVFHEIVATKILILDRTKFVPPAGIAIVFAEVAHNCVTTTIFGSSYSMNFYNGFLGSTI